MMKRLSPEEGERFQRVAIQMLGILGMSVKDLEESLAVIVAVNWIFVTEMASPGHEMEAFESIVKSVRATLSEDIHGRIQ